MVLTKTGLMWAKCSVGQSETNCAIGSSVTMNWNSALNVAENSSLAGYTDWRLPNKNELASLQEKRCYNPSINSIYFPNTYDSRYYWSSSPAAYSGASWIVNFYDGYVNDYLRGNSYAARLVRSGQWLLPLALNVAKTGNGAGSVSSNPAGINCGTDTLTAIAATGSMFAGWGDACTGTAITCTVTMDAAKSATATFNLLPKPDFTIPVMTIAPAVPVTNGTFTATVTVKNQGTVAADGGQLRLWANQATAPACAATGGDKNVAVGTVAAGISTTFTITGLNAGVSGSKTLRAFVDAACARVETNETNNQRTLSYRISGRLPDLIITNIALTPAAPARNAVFNAAITVKNQGTYLGSGFLDVWTNQATTQTCGAVGNVWADVGVLVHGAIKIITVTGLNPGATTGTKTLRAFVDSWCETVESNETNNQLTKTYTVQ